jgi:cytochrome c553
MKRLLPVAVALATLFAAGSALAQGTPDPLTGGDAEKGAAKAAVCAACHGPGGNSSNPEWPKLAGQHAPYALAQLQAFKSGARKNPLMNAQVAALSEQDMKDLAAYFAAQKPQPGIASPDAVPTAEALYRVGDAQRGLPACIACHGPQGAGNAAAAYPRIGGQHARYSATALRQLHAEAASAGAQSNRAVMAAVAAKLSDAEIEALASYVNGLQ